MSSRLARLGDGIVSVAAVLVAVSVSLQLMDRWSRTSDARAAQLAAGTAAPALEGVSFASAPHTALLFVRSTCRFCTESMPFYKRLSASRGPNRFQLIVISAEPKDTTEAYLRANDVAADGILSVRGAPVGITGTPTLLVVNRTGQIVRSWVGWQPEAGEKEIAGVLGL